MMDLIPLPNVPRPEASICHKKLDENLVELLQEKLKTYDLIYTDLGDGDYYIPMSWNIFQKAFKQDLINMRDEEEDKYEPNVLKDFMQSFPLAYRQDPDKLFAIEFYY